MTEDRTFLELFRDDKYVAAYVKLPLKVQRFDCIFVSVGYLFSSAVVALSDIIAQNISDNRV